MTIPQQMLLNAQSAPIERPIVLHAGPLTAQFDQGTLRYIRLGRVELLRIIYSAVRDHNWNTIPGSLSDVHIDQQPASFNITFVSTHQQHEVHFRWQGQISGTADGTIRFAMQGEVLSDFKRNRIGFCILHPMECAGVACRVERVDGSVTDAQFPQSIAPHQPFINLRAVEHEYQPGQWVEVRMEGDTFEMEDQRNWIDASFKTYCTPLEQPFPVLVTRGTRIEQVITLSLVQTPSAVGTVAERSLSLTPVQHSSHPTLPAIGLGSATHNEPLNATALERLRGLKLAHIRVDVHLSEPDWRATLTRRAQEATQIGAALEVALHLGKETHDAEKQLKDLVEMQPHITTPIVRWLVFRAGEASTREATMILAREHLGSAIALVTGTDAFFTDLNRQRPPHHVADGVVYSINPQVHAFDDASLVETLATQATTVQNASQFSGNKPIHVGPVTFKMRWNPNATGDTATSAPEQLPSQADTRQMSVFGAAWTLGSLKYLALGGASSVTFYETTGYLGVMSTAGGSTLPEVFPDVPGGVFPMYHVFADIAEFTGAEVLDLHSSDMLRADGFGLRKGDQVRYMICNLTPDAQEVTLALSGTFILRTLDGSIALDAMSNPEAFRNHTPETISAVEDSLRLQLTPFAVLTLDQQS